MTAPNGKYVTTSRRYGLAQRRKAMGFSQEQLAERLGVDRSTIVRWERGDTEPQPWARPKLAEALQVSVDQLVDLLEAVPRPNASTSMQPVVVAHSSQRGDRSADQEGTPEFNDMNRRELLRLMSMAGTLVAVSGIEDALDWERLDYFAGGAHQLDPAAIEEYATLNSHLWRAW
jgi:transcriptional regulator with XRE-family HTH domain